MYLQNQHLMSDFTSNTTENIEILLLEQQAVIDRVLVT